MSYVQKYHSGLLVGWKCGVTGRQFAAMSPNAAQLESLRLEAEAASMATVEALTAKFGRRETIVDYRALFQGEQS